MNLYSRILLTLLPVFLGLRVTLAASTAELPSVSFKAVCFDPKETETPVFFINHSGKRKPLELDKTRLSDLQQTSVRDGRFVDFFTSEVAKEGELPSATLTLPANSTENLLFVLAPAETRYKACAIQLPSTDFKPGSTLMVNAAPMEIAVRLGKAKPVIVPSAKSQILPIPNGTKEPMLPVQIFNRHAESDQWKIAQSTRWPVDFRFRAYVFFYQSPKNGQLMLHGITERMVSFETAGK